MEEHVGQLWDRLITRAATRRYPAAAVTLQQVSKTAGVLFRALGGDGGLRVEAATASAHGARRSWLQRIAGSNTDVELSWRDAQALRLPAAIDNFAATDLNRDLYLWLVALAAQADSSQDADWFVRSQQQTQAVLQRCPGMRTRYQRLVSAHLEQRPDPARLRADEAAQEQAIRDALNEPGCSHVLPVARKSPQPVLLWLHPAPPLPAGAGGEADDPASGTPGSQDNSKELEDQRRRQAERVAMPEADRGLITVRMENIFTWGEFAKVDRGAEENEDLDEASDAAASIDKFSVTRDGKSVASRLRFDLDLPSASCDDQLIGEGVLVPEWDYQAQCLQPDHCPSNCPCGCGARRADSGRSSSSWRQGGSGITNSRMARRSISMPTCASAASARPGMPWRATGCIVTCAVVRVTLPACCWPIFPCLPMPL
jgi:nitric oxide reductase NorD protein